MIDLIIIIVLATALGVGVFGIVRNEMVFRYRGTLLDDISRGARADIGAGHPWGWRYEAYDTVDYNAMVWQFWRRFDSFYPNQSFRRLA